MLGADREEVQKQLGWSDKYYAIRYKNVIDFVDSESIDYMMQKDNMLINKKQKNKYLNKFKKSIVIVREIIYNYDVENN